MFMLVVVVLRLPVVVLMDIILARDSQLTAFLFYSTYDLFLSRCVKVVSGSTKQVLQMFRDIAAGHVDPALSLIHI